MGKRRARKRQEREQHVRKSFVKWSETKEGGAGGPIIRELIVSKSVPSLRDSWELIGIGAALAAEQEAEAAAARRKKERRHHQKEERGPQTRWPTSKRGKKSNTSFFGHGVSAPQTQLARTRSEVSENEAIVHLASHETFTERSSHVRFLKARKLQQEELLRRTLQVPSPPPPSSAMEMNTELLGDSFLSAHGELHAEGGRELEGEERQTLRSRRGPATDSITATTYSTKYVGVANGVMGILSKRRKIPEVSYLDAAHGKTKQSTLPSDLRTLYKLDPAYVETVVRQVYGGENSDQRAQRQTRGMYVSASAPGGIAIDRVQQDVIQPIPSFEPTQSNSEVSILARSQSTLSRPGSPLDSLPLAQKIARVPVVARANEELFDTGGGVDGGSVDSRAISPTLSMTPAVGGIEQANPRLPHEMEEAMLKFQARPHFQAKRVPNNGSETDSSLFRDEVHGRPSSSPVLNGIHQAHVGGWHPGSPPVTISSPTQFDMALSGLRHTEMPHIVHSRVYGWKLTSPTRRQMQLAELRSVLEKRRVDRKRVQSANLERVRERSRRAVQTAIQRQRMERSVWKPRASGGRLENTPYASIQSVTMRDPLPSPSVFEQQRAQAMAQAKADAGDVLSAPPVVGIEAEMANIALRSEGFGEATRTSSRADFPHRGGSPLGSIAVSSGAFHTSLGTGSFAKVPSPRRRRRRHYKPGSRHRRRDQQRRDDGERPRTSPAGRTRLNSRRQEQEIREPQRRPIVQGEEKQKPRAKSANLWFSPSSSPPKAETNGAGPHELYLELLRKNATQTLPARDEDTRP